MSKFIIKGGVPLKGEVKISGSKNAALPILAATLLTNDTCKIYNVPNITDIQIMIKILKKLGSRISFKNNKITISNKNVRSFKPDYTLVTKIRASVLLMGALLGRFGKVKIAHPGGCLIGSRPIDIHLEGLKSLGVKIVIEDNNFILKTLKLKGANINPKKISVTGTENILMAACVASGKTVISPAAAEPEVIDLVSFLKKMGAKIKGEGTNKIEVLGVKKLKGTEHSVIPDRIEAGTFIIAALVTKGNVIVKNINIKHLESFLEKLKELNVRFDQGPDFIHVKYSDNFKATNIKTAVYPGFATDFQAPISVLLIQASGKSTIFETIFEERLNYLNQLVKMEAKAKILGPQKAEIYGPSQLKASKISSLDLRAGATLILAALCASGESEIGQAELIDRGYEKIEEKLRNLGAKIRRVEK